ncbi:DUF4249 domain-containing protein [Reichenbachiella ulvae]|uniref:DUF4249 domain-containing protein n=1 Tax=Reichenbachiella ulvae TaxID=2980104 RepID=A0ABT3CR35_9BACT|nr:DUF4249 domain-containing protein [Reichenbachiella ulvae]MCV9386155.1 DUF4249 domain-containing protein [Reichenbachiella ulvae]
MKNPYVIILLLVFSSCLEPVEIDLPDGDNRRVVYGWLSSVPEDCLVKLQWSNSFNDAIEFERIKGATVYVTSNSEKIDFVEQTEEGLYLPSDYNFEFLPNNFYRLWVITDGDTLVSDFERLGVVSPVDSVFSSFLVDPDAFDISNQQPNYYISALIDDDPNVRNFYRWKVYVNGEEQKTANDLILFDDLITNGNRFRMDANNVLFTIDDSVSFKNLSLSEAAYNYYVAVQLQTVNSTLEPNVRPTNIIGNIKNMTHPDQEVFGFFGVSDVQVINDVTIGN